MIVNNINTKKESIMNKIIKVLTLSLVVFYFLTTSLNSFAQTKSGSKKDKLLGNKTYTIEIKEKAGKKSYDPIPDELSFKSDKIKSKFLALEYKFQDAPYTIVDLDTTKAEEKSFTFEAESKNDKEEIIKWEGTVYVTPEENTIEATAVVVDKKGKKKREFSITGNLKEKKKGKK